MSSGISLKLALFFTCFLTASSCATVIEGTTDKVRYEGGPGKLAFYDNDGKQIPSEYEFDEIDRIHVNYIELDKRQPEHIITARSGNEIQQDTLRRKVDYAWLIPDGLLIYPLPVFAGVDILSSSIYSFPLRRVHLVTLDTVLLPTAVPMTLQSVAEERYNAQKFLLTIHSGVVTPLLGSSDIPPAYGLSVGYNLGKKFWSAVGYNYSRNLGQQVGQLGRDYQTTVHSVEAAVQYHPVKFAYALAGMGFDHMIFELASDRSNPEKRFGRNVMTAGFGAGVFLGGVFLEARRNIALSRIETPEGPGHYVQFTHIRFGVALKFGS